LRSRTVGAVMCTLLPSMTPSPGEGSER
jgi:hypothetical protein